MFLHEQGEFSRNEFFEKSELITALKAWKKHHFSQGEAIGLGSLSVR